MKTLYERAKALGNQKDERYFISILEDDGCFYWYACDYFTPHSTASRNCPIVTVENEYKNQLDGYFGNMWHGPFKKWFKEHFELPVKTIE